MSQPVPNIVMMDDKTAITPPTEKEDVSKTEVLSSGPSSQDPFFLAFDTKDAEWHKAFEKKLMRKVDMRLIPLLIIMYLNNFVGMSEVQDQGRLKCKPSNSLLLRSRCIGTSTSGFPRSRSRHDRHAVQPLHLDPVRRLPYDAAALESPHHPHAPFAIPGNHHAGLGRSLRCDGCRAELCTVARCPHLPWCH
jgi:hypothetical protein